MKIWSAQSSRLKAYKKYNAVVGTRIPYHEDVQGPDLKFQPARLLSLETELKFCALNYLSAQK